MLGHGKIGAVGYSAFTAPRGGAFGNLSPELRNSTEEYYAYDQTPFTTRGDSSLPSPASGRGAGGEGGEGSQMLFRFEGPEVSDLKSRYLWAPVIDLLLSDEKLTGPSTPGDVYWALGDNVNTVRDIAKYDIPTDTTPIVNHRTFDAFGKLTSESNSAIDLIFGFTGRLNDESTGLQNNLNRWYDPTVGRWLSEDPIGFSAGDANLYRYVNNGPTYATDPRGLGWWCDLLWGYSTWSETPKGRPEVTQEYAEIGITENARFFGPNYIRWHTFDASRCRPQDIGRPCRVHWSLVQFYEEVHKDRNGNVVSTKETSRKIRSLGMTEGNVVRSGLGYGCKARKPRADAEQMDESCR